MEWYQLQNNPMCRKENVVQGNGFRITVLTECLMRLEYSESNQFEDRATQIVWNRDFDPVDFTVIETKHQLEIVTKKLHLIYDKKPFSEEGLKITLCGDSVLKGQVWKYGQIGWNLGGTIRTLDGVDGYIHPGHGILSKTGFADLDDSNSLVIQDNGWIAPRNVSETDCYFFGYGREYLTCLKDFYYLCGKTPMIPRYALGNWWSRYYEYTEESYKELMDRFEKEQIPFSVAVIDMDWHLVNIDAKYGSGWTGYTWNRELFPDPDGFLKWLHERGMKVTLNVHPALGIRGHEEMYSEMAKAMGVDANQEEPIEFDITSEQFLSAYFQYVNHPHEDRGVDFWWLDWQQGTSTKLKGLDPLWMLNHYHYLDNGRHGKRPMTFSRYAGPGSHRYPIGFSGDTVISWKSLDFQPYFTSTASNIGYGWWSHDIGGHMGGMKNDELEARWYQYGVFSPINRLHSTKNPFNGKEPWRFREDVRRVMGEFLRLRHQLIPYLYTMNYRAYQEDLPMIQPMYYLHPNEEAAYQVKNQYYFGSELMVAPITTGLILGINQAKVKVWLPKGKWNDFFTGMHYEGGQEVWMYRGISSIPVLARDGAIIPMTKEIMAKEVGTNPKQLTIRMYGGANGRFTLYEDENETRTYEDGICVKTKIQLDWEEKTITIEKPVGKYSLIPEMRQWNVELAGVTNGTVTVWVEGIQQEVQTEYDAFHQILHICVTDVPSQQEIKIVLGDSIKQGSNQVKERVFELLNQAEIAYECKETIYNMVCNTKEPMTVLYKLLSLDIPEEWLKCIGELLQ